ncbi:MAG: DsrE family protein [Bacteroidota bacterium]
MRHLPFLLLLFINYNLNAQRVTGPIITEFGSVYAVENPDFKTDTNKVYRVIFDIYDTPEDPTKVNPSLNTLARFLNMHAQTGVPLKNLQVAGVFHNKATHDALGKSGYRTQYGVDNPNTPLLAALEKAGAQLYICGQSVSARGVDRTQIDATVEVALSAMTVILSYQADGYQLIKF